MRETPFGDFDSEKSRVTAPFSVTETSRDNPAKNGRASAVLSIKQDGKAFKPGVTPTTAVKAFPRTGGGQKEGGGGQERPPPSSKAGTQDETKKRIANEREKLTGHFICGLQLRSGLQSKRARASTLL